MSPIPRRVDIDRDTMLTMNPTFDPAGDVLLDLAVMSAFYGRLREAADAVRELHKPVLRDNRYTAYFDDAPAALMCDGCPDVSNGEYNLTDWPCATARLVYSPTEIEETTQTGDAQVFDTSTVED